MLRFTRCAALQKFDVCVLGGGPSGIAAALRAIDFGKTACIVESDEIGGADLWNGALQSKTMWEMAKFSRLIHGKTARRFLKRVKPIPPLNSSNIRKAIQEAAETRQAQIVHQLQYSNIAVLKGKGRFTSPHRVSVAMGGGATEDVDADYFIIATGAQPRAHPTVKWDGKTVFTSDDIMQHDFPKSVVIIGAGVIGCEFATIFANFGKTQVNVIEKSNRILPMEDEDISIFVQKLLESKGVLFHHHSALVDNETVDGKFHYTLQDLRDASQHKFVVDSALVSIGRVPNVDDIGLSTLGIQAKGGRIALDSYHRLVPHKHIYSCGDVSTRAALVNVGELEGRKCIEHIYSPVPEEQVFPTIDNLSTIMFLDQEVAAVGLNEQQCKSKNIAYKMARYGYEFVTRAVAMGNTKGFVKLIVTNDAKMQVLGVRAIGPHASSVIELASLAIHNNESAYNLRELRTAYPAVTQGFQECLHMLLGSSILKPNVFPELVVKEWTPPAFTRGRAFQQEELQKESSRGDVSPK